MGATVRPMEMTSAFIVGWFCPQGAVLSQTIPQFVRFMLFMTFLGLNVHKMNLRRSRFAILAFNGRRARFFVRSAWRRRKTRRLSWRTLSRAGRPCKIRAFVNGTSYISAARENYRARFPLATAISDETTNAKTRRRTSMRPRNARSRAGIGANSRSEPVFRRESGDGGRDGALGA